MRYGKSVFPRSTLVGLCLLFLLTLLVSPTHAAGNTVLDVAWHDGACATWVRAVNTTDLNVLLTLKGPFTVFVPNDTAYAAMPAAERARMMQNNTTLRQALLYYIVPGRLTAADLQGRASVMTALGVPLRIEQRDGALWLDGIARVVATDQIASNGIVHMVDAVLPLPSIAQTTATPGQIRPGSLLALLAADGRFTQFVSDITTVGMEPLLNNHGQFTVFAPTDAAYATLANRGALLANHRLLRQMLLYHLVRGVVPAAELTTGATLPTALGRPLSVSATAGTPLLNGQARVVQGDMRATNGVAHAIDVVLRPSAGAYDSPDLRPILNRNPGNILDVMANDPQLSRFVTRIQYSGLENLLVQHRPFTVFAPTNAAIDALPPEFTCACMENRTLLKELMLFHIVPGRYSAAQLAEQSALRSAFGESIPLTQTANGPLIDGAQLVVRDIQATNGVIHVVDVVLRPAGR